MKTQEITREKEELQFLCDSVREGVHHAEYEKCEEIIAEAMSRFPHAPEPHNLMGIVLEKEGNHVAAMKHFRASWALDPVYRPTRENLETFGTFFSRGKCMYDERDCEGC